MLLNNNLSRLLEAKNYLVNMASSKSQANSKNIRMKQKLSRLAKMPVIIILAIFFVRFANAQTDPDPQQAVQPIILDNIKSLEEAIKPMLGKKIYIDIWATWCKPCILEFANNEALEKIMDENDIQQLFICIDSDLQVKNWKDCIKQYNLTGTHIRVNKEFSSDIQKLFFTFGGRIQIAIPRYILIDEEGNIMVKNAKRPSQLVAGEKLW